MHNLATACACARVCNLMLKQHRDKLKRVSCASLPSIRIARAPDVPQSMPSDSDDEAIAAEAATDDVAQRAWQETPGQARVFKLDCRLRTGAADTADAAKPACQLARVPTTAATGVEGRDGRTVGVSHMQVHGAASIGFSSVRSRTKLDATRSS